VSRGTLYQVSTEYATAGVVVHDGKVVQAAPIYRWMIGKYWEDCKSWKKITEVRNATKTENISSS